MNKQRRAELDRAVALIADADYASVNKALRVAFGPTPLFDTFHERDAWIEENADYFTAIRGIGTTRSRDEFATKAEALAAQPRDGRTMIYAVAPDGAFAHLCNI